MSYAHDAPTAQISSPVARLMPRLRDPRFTVGFVMLAAGLLLVLSDQPRRYHTPDSAFRVLHRALSSGDVATLVDDPALGQHADAAGLVTQLGEVEYLRVRGLLERAAQVGSGSLSVAERVVVQGLRYETFVAGREIFVQNAGRNALHNQLLAAFGSSRYTVRSARQLGDGPRDLVQRASVRARLGWRGVAEASGWSRVPGEVTLRWSKSHGRWDIATVRWVPVAQAPFDGDLPPPAAGTGEPAAPGAPHEGEGP